MEVASYTRSSPSPACSTRRLRLPEAHILALRAREAADATWPPIWPRHLGSGRYGSLGLTCGIVQAPVTDIGESPALERMMFGQPERNLRPA